MHDKKYLPIILLIIGLLFTVVDVYVSFADYGNHLGVLFGEGRQQRLQHCLADIRVNDTVERRPERRPDC